mmetsp:Transcript_73877/g.158395  ORF Transcript_73877/g.158395 Transcript_73877/m.158395 type:complete len:104 (+) Transcript_73877:118-429(+)
MASFMFLGFQLSATPHYEDRVEYNVEGPKLREVWQGMEQRCFEKYLAEVDDDHQGTHVYSLLKHEVSQCKRVMLNDNRREVLQDCTSKIVSLYRRCSSAPPTE